VGLRERKKEQTRQLIADTAARLFAADGFDRVTVADVAREAQVAVATVFNYFPTKEDLFYSRLDTFGARLVEAIGQREAGKPVLAAFRRHLMAVGGLLARAEAGDREAFDRLRAVNQTIAASPALLAREQRATADHTESLAAFLATEAGDPFLAQVVANALMGVHRALVEHVRRGVLAGDEPARLAADVRDHCARALDLLEHGLRDYDPRRHHMSTSISRDELRAAIDDKSVVVVDALPAAPYGRRHLPGALNLVSDDADAKAGDLLPDRGAAVVTYSTDVHCGRGEALAERLRALGYTDVRTYHEGIEDWVGAGLAVEDGHS